MRPRLFKTLRLSSPSCKYSFIHIHTTCIQAHKFLYISIWKSINFLSMKNALLNTKPQPSGCILVTAHFTAPPRDGLESWCRAQWLSKNWLLCRGSRKRCKFWASVSTADRQADRLSQALDNQGTTWSATVLDALKIHRKLNKKNWLQMYERQVKHKIFLLIEELWDFLFYFF